MRFRPPANPGTAKTQAKEAKNAFHIPYFVEIMVRQKYYNFAAQLFEQIEDNNQKLKAQVMIEILSCFIYFRFMEARRLNINKDKTSRFFLIAWILCFTARFELCQIA